LVFHSSTVTMMHGPINISLKLLVLEYCDGNTKPLLETCHKHSLRKFLEETRFNVTRCRNGM